MTATPSLRRDFTIKCSCCGLEPSQYEYKCSCGQPFNVFLNNFTCPDCLKELEIYCDPANQGCGHTAPVEEWIEQLPAIVKTMLDEVTQITAEEFKARKILESYFQYSEGDFISKIPFESGPFTLGASDCAVPFSTFSTKELIDLFNKPAGIETLSRTECRRMFLLIQELVKRGINFNFFKSHDREKDVHKIWMGDAIELSGKKVVLTFAGRMRYM